MTPRQRHHVHHRPSAVAEENLRAVARIRERSNAQRTWGQRVSDRVATIAAREATVVLHVAWFAAWYVLNARVLPMRPFDPFPYPLLTTIVSLEAIFLSLFVLASQQRLTQEADNRADLDLQVNLLSEQEMTVVLQMLREVCHHLGLRDTIDSRKFRELAENLDIGDLAARVERNIAAHPDAAHHAAHPLAEKERG